MTNDLMKEATRIKQWLIDIRRDFHRYPELGMEEYRTRDKIVEYLTELGIPYEKNIANTGVVGLIEGGKPGKTVALRGDIDALPITELNDIDYKSQHEGKMHACGHDAHTTIVLGAARFLHEMKDDLEGNVKLFFQPAEETVGGAKPMIEEGVMENPTVDAVFGLHVDTQLPTGEIGIKYGQMNASSDTVYITVKGTNAHGASPQLGVDAIVMAAHVITSLQTIISRNIDAREAAVLSIGTIEGGTQSNIVADEVKMVGTIRALDPDIRRQVITRIEEIVEYTTRSMGGSYELSLGDDGYIALINNDEMVQVVKQSGEDLLGKHKVQTIDRPSMGVEDFSFFAAAAPSAFYRLGCRNEDKGIIHGAHTGKFNIDEDCLPIGVALQVNNVLQFLNNTN